MIKTVLSNLSIVAFLALMACTPEKKPINYGQDNCEYCNMTIVDKQYGSEVVTTKGKVYKFDAVECMINFLNDGKVDKKDVAMKLVNTYNEPGKLLKASESYYLRSQNLPSPMGLFITPFTDKNQAKKVQNQKGGEIYTWQSLKANFDQFSKDRQKGQQ